MFLRAFVVFEVISLCVALDESPSEVQQTMRHVSTAVSADDAGTELFILATNFLLYIALVIITYLLQKMYFPHSIEKVAAPQTTMEGCSELEMEPLTNEENGISMPTRKLPRASSLNEFAKMIEFQNVNAEDMKTMTKKGVLNRLAFCVMGLNVSFLIWGVLQERMLTQPYNDGEYFSSSYGLVFLNRLGGFIISGLMLYAFKPPHTEAIIYEFSFPSVSNMLSSWCQYEALKYISFPTAMLFKCFKLVPIMLMGKYLGNKTYPAYDYVVSLLIGFGIALFMISTEDMEFGMDSIGTPETWSGTMCGLMLLGFFLLFDSFTGQWQSRMFHQNECLSPFHMMFAVNTFSMVFSFITLVHTKELQPFWEFVVRHPEMHFHVMAFSVCSTVGQLFIFKTIQNFGAVVFAIIMNVRVILSIFVSCVLYSHTISSEGMFGLFIVFASVAYRTQRKTRGKDLIHWRASQDQGTEWFHEVHEHVDM